MQDTTTKIDFKETGVKLTDPGRREILSRRINELSLKIPGTRLEGLINQLYLELENHGVAFRPKCYLSDEWGCPHGIPVIGIPFYLADQQLSQLEGELTGIEAESDEEVMMYLRHETGHAFNYAYRLYLQPEWRSIFGLFSRPYKENYKPKPFSPSFVRHIPGWYTQKHPDEDFSETFAVWLTPNSNWRKTYTDTPALTKLLYVERVVAAKGKNMPIVTEITLDSPVEELTDTLTEWYDTITQSHYKVSLPTIINEDLRTLFPPVISEQLASTFINNYRRRLSQNINRWTGIDRELIEVLINELIKRANVLNLKVDPERTDEIIINLSTFATTLVMNYLYTDNFVML